MANSKLHDDLINEVEPQETAEESIKSLMLAVADRIEGCNGNKVKLSDLATVLRENPEAVGKAVLANTDLAKVPTRTTGGDSASTTFDKPRVGAVNPYGNDHRDQVFPPTANTEAEKERIRRETIDAGRGNKPYSPPISDEERAAADKKAQEDRKRADDQAAADKKYADDRAKLQPSH